MNGRIFASTHGRTAGVLRLLGVLTSWGLAMAFSVVCVVVSIRIVSFYGWTVRQPWWWLPLIARFEYLTAFEAQEEFTRKFEERLSFSPITVVSWNDGLYHALTFAGLQTVVVSIVWVLSCSFGLPFWAAIVLQLLVFAFGVQPLIQSVRRYYRART